MLLENVVKMLRETADDLEEKAKYNLIIGPSTPDLLKEVIEFLQLNHQDGAFHVDIKIGRSWRKDPIGVDFGIYDGSELYSAHTLADAFAMYMAAHKNVENPVDQAALAVAGIVEKGF